MEQQAEPAELIERWAQERGKHTYYVYSTINLELISTFFGANQLSKILDIGLYSAQYITKFIKSSSYLAIVYKDFIISFRPHSSEVWATS